MNKSIQVSKLNIYQSNKRKFVFFNLLLLLILFNCGLIAQNYKVIDSIKKQINNSKIDTIKVIASINIGDLFRNSIPDSALYYYNIALSNATKANNKNLIASGCNQIGLIYRDQGAMDKALSYYMQSLKIYEEIGNKSGMSKCYNNIGMIHIDICGSIDSMSTFKKAEYNKAIEYCFMSLKIDKELSDIKGMSKSYINLGSIYAELKSFDTAIVYFNEALKLKEKLADKLGISKCYNNIGLVYFFKSDYKNAIDYYLKSLKIKGEIDDKNGISLVLGNITISQINLKNYHQAIDFALRALSIAKETGALPYQKNVYQHLATAYDSLKNYKKAYEFQKLMIEINEQILNEESNDQIKQMEAHYQFEKKQLEIDNLTKDKTLKETIVAKQRVVIYSFLFGLIIVVLFSFLLFRQYQAKKKANILLAQKNIDIQQKNNEITSQSDEIQKQNLIIAHKNANITASITYAKRIQSAILPPKEIIEQLIPDSFIFYKPKSIVSGDFYWLEQHEQYIYIAAVDCTGHGVPGALMSIVGYNILNQALNEKHLLHPSEIIDYLSVTLAKTLRQTDDAKSVRDGMDLMLCRIDKSNLQLEYSGSHLPLYIIRKGKLIEYKSEMVSIGQTFLNNFLGFSNQSFKLETNDLLYLFSDGYIDQFNGETDQKFSNIRFKELLVRIAALSMSEQQTKLEEQFEKWKGKSEQIDDVMVIGIKT